MKPAYVKKYQGGPGIAGRPSQERIISFIRSRLDAEKPQPTFEEIRKFMGWQNVTSVKDALRKIAANGALPKGFDRSVIAPTDRERRYWA